MHFPLSLSGRMDIKGEKVEGEGVGKTYPVKLSVENISKTQWT